MDKFVIRGGNPLLGTIRVSGAKNSALPCMAAAILTEDEVVLENVPQVRDIETERRLLVSMGAEVELGYGRAQHRTSISCRVLSDPTAKYEIVKTMRASSLVLGPLLARCGLARVAQPGGCAIGDRPIDLHLKGLEAMGAHIVQEHGYLEARAERLHGAHIVFDKITVTGTEDLLMAAVLADGDTLFENCAREPEVTDLAALLICHGRQHRRGRHSNHSGEGREQAARRQTSHQPGPHRSWNVSGCRRYLGRRPGGGQLPAGPPLCSHREVGGMRRARHSSGAPIPCACAAKAICRPTISPQKSTPASLPTCRAQYMALATQAEGTTTVKENIFENRFMHVGELRPHGSQHQGRRPHGHRSRQDASVFRSGDVLRPARFGFAGSGCPGSRR